MEAFLLIPLAAGLVFAMGAMCLKRSTNDGVGPWRTTFVSNLTLAILCQPIWLMEGSFDWRTDWLPPLIASIGFFLGQLFGCLAIHKGDVSVVTPLLGTKPVLVGFFAAALYRQSLPWPIWLGAVLSALAILLLRGDGIAERKRLLPSVLLGLASAASFAMLDVFMQEMGREVGFSRMVPATFLLTAAWSFALLPLFGSGLNAVNPKARRWLLAGSLLVAAQAIGFAFVLTTFGRATEANIFYSSRGFWSIALVWLIGHWFANTEREQGSGTMVRRLAGSLLLVLAIVATLWA